MVFCWQRCFSLVFINFINFTCRCIPDVIIQIVRLPLLATSCSRNLRNFRPKTNLKYSPTGFSFGQELYWWAHQSGSIKKQSLNTIPWENTRSLNRVVVANISDIHQPSTFHIRNSPTYPSTSSKNVSCETSVSGLLLAVVGTRILPDLPKMMLYHII